MGGNFFQNRWQVCSRIYRNKEIARELEKMLLEKASKKKIGEFIKKLKQE